MFNMATLKLFLVPFLAASALAVSAPAMADWKSKEVRHDDLDLSTANGQQLLTSRVKRAVREVCRSPRAITLAEHLDQSNCEKAALAAAMPKAQQAIAAYNDKARLSRLKERQSSVTDI
jgi:UrcA family protein